MPSQRDIERSRDRIASFIEIATAPGASYSSQQAALAGMRRELQKAGATRAAAEDLVSISSRTPATPEYRAAYLINAAQRLKESERPHTQAVLAELDNYRKHVRADNQRLYGAQRIRAAVNSYGPLVGWYAVLDERTTPECRDMHGKNFDPLEPPAAGLPGVTHVNCRCRPGPPHQEGVLAESESTSLALVRSPGMTRLDSSVELSDLNWSPKKNWVEKRGGLPPYVVRIAKRLIAKGFSRSHAIATAINVVKKMKNSGDLNFPGRQKVNAGSRAEATSAVARWTAMKNMSSAEKGLELATKNKAKGLSYGQGAKKLGRIHLVNVARLAKAKPGAPPQRLPKLDPSVRSPKGGLLEPTKHGAVPKGGVPKRVGVKSSAVKGHGSSDATKVKVRQIKKAMASNANWNPNADQRHALGMNLDAGVKPKRAGNHPVTPSAGGPKPRKKPVAKDSAKGSGHAAPAKRASGRVSLALIPGQKSGTRRSIKTRTILKKLQKWSKSPKRIKVNSAPKRTNKPRVI